MKVAIVGAGMSGLMAGSRLHEKGVDFDIYEASDYIGGHAKTMDVTLKNGKTYPIDVGVCFIYNDYFNTNKYIDKFKLKRIFYGFDSVFYYNFLPDPFSIGENQYISLNFNTNIKNLKFSTHNLINAIRFLKQHIKIYGLSSFFESFQCVPKFLKTIIESQKKRVPPGISVYEYCLNNKISDHFRDKYIVTALCALWGGTKQEALTYDAQMFLDCFYKLLHSSVFLIDGGMRPFLNKISEKFKDRIHLSDPVLKIFKENDEIVLQSKSGTFHYDDVIFATQPSVVRKILDGNFKVLPFLTNFKCIRTKIFIHEDKKWMPQDKKSTRYFMRLDDSPEQSVWTEWCGKLHPEKPDIFLSYGENLSPDQFNPLIACHTFERFAPTATYAQLCRQFEIYQGEDHLWHCGAHVQPPESFSNIPSHENAMLSGLHAADLLCQRNHL